MIIRRVGVTNFRSHEKIEIDFTKQTTEIIGENGCGKTSILEAIYEVLQGKSFRAVDREILKRGADFYRVNLEYDDGHTVSVVYDGVKKEFLCEDKKSRRLIKKFKYPIVLFEPDDLNLVGASPTSRRNYFDRIFSQLSQTYADSLLRYNKALRQRNELLKQDLLNFGDLFSWNVLITKHGMELVETRRKFVEKINQEFTDIYRSIAENNDEIRLRFNSEVKNESDFLKILEQDFERDKIIGHTGFGAHRDNYEFVFNGSTADGSASRGEVRSSILALKFIEAKMILEILGKQPIVLLDDVFSELDETRQRCLVKNFKENQIILTSVGAGKLTIK